MATHRYIVVGVDNSYPPDPMVWTAGQYYSETSAEKDRARFMKQRSIEAGHITYHTIPHIEQGED